MLRVVTLPSVPSCLPGVGHGLWGGLPLLGGAGGGHGDGGRVASGVDCGVAADDDEDDDLKLRSLLTCCWKFALGRAPSGAGSP